MNEHPKAGRPYMPEYGVPKDRKGLLSWSWAQERLESAPFYWISSVRADGRPHCMPVWAIFENGLLYFSTGRKSRKARNLQSNPACSVSVQYGNDAVILEGVASEVSEPEILRLSGLYQTKYGMALDPGLGPVYRVSPSSVFGFKGTAHANDSSSDFSTSATRWTFAS